MHSCKWIWHRKFVNIIFDHVQSVLFSYWKLYKIEIKTFQRKKEKTHIIANAYKSFVEISLIILSDAVENKEKVQNISIEFRHNTAENYRYFVKLFVVFLSRYKQEKAKRQSGHEWCLMFTNTSYRNIHTKFRKLLLEENIPIFLQTYTWFSIFSIQHKTMPK